MITLDTLDFTYLTAQPFGYEGDARSGQTARQFQLSGLFTRPQWAALVALYDAWRSDRILDPDTLAAGDVGHTVPLTLEANGVSVTALACWFTEAPKAEQLGSWVQGSVTLVDAAQALQVLLADAERRRQGQEGAIPALGNVTLGSCTITLTRPMEGRQGAPTVAMTAGGSSYITGPLASHETLQIEGWISSGTPADLRSWFDGTIAAVPSVGTWFPVGDLGPPSAEVIISGGVKATRYSVNFTVLKIR